MKVSVESLDLEHRLAYRFAMLSAQATRCLGDLYREHGLTVVGWRTLSLIGRYEPIYPSSIAERTSVDADKVTRAVDRLVAKRLVVRKVDAEDRRRIVLRLTAHGRRVHAEIDRVRRMLLQIRRRFSHESVVAVGRSRCGHWHTLTIGEKSGNRRRV